MGGVNGRMGVDVLWIVELGMMERGKYLCTGQSLTSYIAPGLDMMGREVWALATLQVDFLNLLSNAGFWSYGVLGCVVVS